MSRTSPARRITVTRHDLSCAVLDPAPGDCGCQPEVTTERYLRVCAHCGGELPNRRRPYCSEECRRDASIAGKSRFVRQRRTEEYLAGHTPP